MFLKKQMVKYQGSKIGNSELQKRKQMLNSEQGNILIYTHYH